MFYLFRTNTTGLIKPKKSRPFNTLEDCIDAGKALNILDGTPDRVFVCIPADQLMCRTNITDPLPFSESFYRLPRLSDSNTKFRQKESLDVDLTSLSETNPELAMAYAGTQINLTHPAITGQVAAPIPADSFFAERPLFAILSDAGLNKSNVINIQSRIQYELGKIPLPKALSQEESTLILILIKCFSHDLNRINIYISSLIMERFNNFGKTETCNWIPFPSEVQE